MKKILVVFLAAMMAVSCFKDGPTNSHQYNLFATFEYVNDYEISEQFGKDSLYVDEVNGLGMLWNDMAFMQKLSDDKKEIKGGFVLSCLKGRMYNEGYESDKSSDLYRVNAPADSSRMYMVFVDAGVDELMPVHDMEFVADQYGSCKVLGCFVNVPLYVAAAASKEFKDGDALTLKATGYLGGKMTAEKSIDLITCDDGKVVLPKKWTSFDLAALGDVQYIDLDVQSSNKNVPEVFCMDNFVARVSIEY
jgi:hypothetical protein